MASVIFAGNATNNGTNIASDNTGAFDFKTGTGAGTTAMTIDASQNVGIGTTSPTAKISINTTTSGTALDSNNSVNSGFIVKYASGLTSIGNNFNNPLVLLTNNTERMRITSGGSLLVGQTANPDGSILNVYGAVVSTFENSQSGSAFAIIFRNPNGIIGSVSTNGSATSYNSSSDYRLKENIAPMVGALATVAQLKPVTYKWKVDGSDGQGFIAHELAEVVPNCVTGEKDAVNEDGSIKPQGIDTSFLVATLTAAIQELKAELDAVKAKVGA
jgi:hypothetical protein